MDKSLRKIFIGCFLFVVVMVIGGYDDFRMKVVCAAEIISGEWTYEVLEDGTARITRYDEEDEEFAGSIEIPEELDGYVVTSVASDFLYYFHTGRIEYLEISKNVKNIEEGAFENCWNLTEIYVDARNTVYDSRNDCNAIVETVTDKLIRGCDNTVIPDDIKIIGSKAFWCCDELDSVTIPEGIVDIEERAFANCRALTSITIPEGITCIKEDVFSCCVSLTSIAIPDGVDYIGEGAFFCCGSLVSINIPEGVKRIEESTFYDCRDLKDIEIPEGVNYIGKSAFYGCSSLGELEIPEAVNFIGEDAFYKCSSLTSITIPEGITKIEDGVFAKCVGLISIEIPEGVTSIGEIAFWECESLTNIYLPEGITSIEEHAFLSCDSLISIEIPETVEYIGESAFCGCEEITNLEIPESTTFIGNGAFSCCSKLKVINVDKENIVYDSRNNCNAIIETSTNTLISGCSETVIPSDVTKIGESAFSGCKNLKTLNIPESVKEIENSAFQSSGLQEVDIPNGVKSIKEYTFAGCNNLEKIMIPEGVDSIGEGAFRGCSKLNSIKLPSSVLYIEWGGFKDCTNLEYIEMPENIISIGAEVFSNTAYYINENNWEGEMLYVGNNFIAAKKYTVGEVSVKEGTRCIAAYAFADCYEIKKIVLPKGIRVIDEGTFSGCEKLVEVIMPEGVEIIEDYAFDFCNKINKVVINDDKTKISEYAFSFCDNLVIYSSPNSYAHIYAIENNIPWKDINGTKVSLSDATIELGTLTYMYDGKSKQPSVTVKYGNKMLVSGTDYTVTYSNNVKVGTATVTVTGIGNYTGTVTKTFVIKEDKKPTQQVTVEKVKLLKQKSTYSTSTITLAWDKVSGVTGYEIYRATSKNGKYAKIKTHAKNSFKDTKLKAGKTYYYKVRAYKLVNGMKIYGDYSSVVAMETKTAKPSIKVKAGKKQVKITWNKVSGANGYEIYMSTSKSGKYKKIKSANAKTISFTKKKLTEGKKYYFKVRTYKKINGKKIYSGWSVVKSVKVK